MAPPAIWRPTSAIRTLAFGMYTSWRSRPVASIGETNAGATPFSAHSADNRSMSVIRACLTRYSTRTDEPRNERAITLPRLTKTRDGRLLWCRALSGWRAEFRSTATPDRLAAALMRLARRYPLYAIGRIPINRHHGLANRRDGIRRPWQCPSKNTSFSMNSEGVLMLPLTRPGL